MGILLAHHTCQISKAEQPSNMEILWAHHICQISKADDTLSGDFLHVESYNQRHVMGNQYCCQLSMELVWSRYHLQQNAQITLNLEILA